MRAAALALVILSAPACSALDPTTLPPLGEAIVEVDTDLPTPLIAGRLRADFYGEDGTWFDSRDIARIDPTGWPTSFSVYSDDELHDKIVWIRLRAYPEGRTRDYRGERFSDWGDPDPPPTDGEAPRLLRDGLDETPPDEPAPLVTVDRLILLRLRYGVRGRVRVTLRGDCAGTMANLGGPTPVIRSAESCIDTERTRAPVVEEALDDNGLSSNDSLTGTWGVEPCPDEPAGDRVCVPGGPTILGSSALAIYPMLAPVPERVVRLSRFWVDRDEVSVARYRAALAAGFKPKFPPKPNDAPLGTTVATACTWTTQPQDREGYALSCIEWRGAREFCQDAGGDLPSEAQWEYLASTAGRAARTRFPWGDDAPTCDRAVYGRLPLANAPGVCESTGKGPAPIANNDADELGVRGLGGGLGEWTLDAYSEYDGACWLASSNVNPGCFSTSGTRTVRGGSWASPPTLLRSAIRLGSGDGGASFEGFRCVYPGPLP
jgi:formylglycine-generating enzyme required for sulfatase activity